MPDQQNSEKLTLSQHHIHPQSSDTLPSSINSLTRIVPQPSERDVEASEAFEFYWAARCP